MITATPLEGLPEIAAGADLGDAISTVLNSKSAPERLRPGDVLAIAHKVVSKAEGRVRSLSEVVPSDYAVELARGGGRDPRLVQVVLDETQEVVRASPGVIVCETRHGFVCANAGVDQSNVPGDDTVLMLPLDPDASARRIRGAAA